MSLKSAPWHPVGTERGFVLVMTLWVLVIVTIAAGYFFERVARAVDLAQQSRQNTRAIIDMAGTRAEILYRLGTTSMTEYGLGRGNTAVNLDNRAYRGLGETLVRLQDDRGLLNLNRADDEQLYRFLGLLGIAAEQRSRLIDTLRDFTDADNLTRLNGAEEADYLALKLRPPTNSNLVTPWEAKRIIGWRDSPQLWKDGRLADLTTASPRGGINPNTAPAEVLATLPGITEEIAQVIIARRQLSPITHEGQIVEITGMPISQLFGLIVIVIPSSSVRITQSSQGRPWATQYNVTLTPWGNEAPWRIDYYSRVGAHRSDEGPIAELPPASSAPPDKAPAMLLGG